MIIFENSGKYVVSTLSPEDRVGVLALADEVTYADVECAGRGPLAPASAETKRRLGRFIDGLTKAKAPADHVLGFSRALDVARRAMLVPPLARYLSSSSSSSSISTYCFFHYFFLLLLLFYLFYLFYFYFFFYIIFNLFYFFHFLFLFLISSYCYFHYIFNGFSICSLGQFIDIGVLNKLHSY